MGQLVSTREQVQSAHMWGNLNIKDIFEKLNILVL
jgi:hypothetical protein